MTLKKEKKWNLKEKSLNRLSGKLTLEEIMFLSRKGYAIFTDKYNLNK
jgi:hypothetical protein